MLVFEDRLVLITILNSSVNDPQCSNEFSKPRRKQIQLGNLDSVTEQRKNAAMYFQNRRITKFIVDVKLYRVELFLQVS